MKICEEGPNPLVFAHAKSFYKAARAIPKIEVLPYLSNLSFAIELLLKSILVRFKYEQRGPRREDIHYVCRSLIRDNKHDLFELFKQLKIEQQTEIADRYRTKTGGDIEADLDRYRTTFIDLRYAFERPPESITVKPLEDIAETVYIFSREVIGPAYPDADGLEKKAESDRL